jgi:hypothetical protein
MSESGWERKSVVKSGLPEWLPDVSAIGVEYDGEILNGKKLGHEDRRFRFVYSHFVEVKTRKPRTPKS